MSTDRVLLICAFIISIIVVPVFMAHAKKPAPRPDIREFVLYDATGKQIGQNIETFLGPGSGLMSIDVNFDSNGEIYKATLVQYQDVSVPINITRMFFDQLDCTGNVYVGLNQLGDIGFGIKRLIFDENMHAYAITDVVTTAIFASVYIETSNAAYGGSSNPNYICENIANPSVGEAKVADPIPELNLDQYQQPFHLELY